MNVTNFNFQANVDDGSCSDDPETVNYSFGGVSLNCSGNLSTSECMRIDCPENFLPLVKIHSFTIGTIHYDAYWCSVKPNADDFLLFGGFYTTTKPNPITGVIGCPNYFYPQHWILGPGVDVFICVSRDKEHGSNYSAAFGGFESCETGNPYTLSTTKYQYSPDEWPHRCPIGYTKYPVAFDNGCWINVCMVFNPTNSIQALLPPFHNYPNSLANETLATTLTGANGIVWIKDPSGQWVTNDTAIGKMSSSNSGTLSDPFNLTIAAASAFGTLVLGAVIVFIGLYAVRGGKRREQQSNNYMPINNLVDKPV